MMDNNCDFKPILLGSDMNVYGMARSFYMEYKVKPLVIGKACLLAIKNSNILEFEVVNNFGDPDVFVPALIKIAERFKDKKLLLISCGDDYVKLIVRNRDKLEKYYSIPYLSKELMDKLVLKENFYNICDEYNFAYPKTLLSTFENYKDLKLEFAYPIIIKPSNSVEYWKCSFPGKKKVFIAHTEKEHLDIINAIYNSSYKDNLIIQEYIPGDDSYMRVLNCYSDKNGKVKLMALGHSLLEEHTPQGIGSYAAIISTYDKEILETYKNFLESVNYVGFSNFDMKYDYRDKKYKLFEINLRTGRSSYYVTASGYNLAKYVTEDFIFNKELDLTYATNKHLWLIVPKGVLFKYLKDENLKNEVKKLIKEKKYTNSLFYQEDFNFTRYLRLGINTITHYRKYKKFYGKKGLSE